MNFRLSDEQQEWQAYCRKFAREVIRPVAAKHDREQSVPWEVMKEAREWKLSGMEYLAGDGEGRGRPLQRHLRRGAPLGLRRHRARDLRLRPRRRRHRLVGHARADRQVGARVLRHRRRHQARRLRGHRGRRRLRRQVAAHDREARRRRVGPERLQGLHLERRHRRRQRRRRDRRPRPRPPRPGLVHRPRRPAAACRWARRRTRSASARRTRASWCSTTAASRSTTCSAGWTS